MIIRVSKSTIPIKIRWQYCNYYADVAVLLRTSLILNCLFSNEFLACTSRNEIIFNEKIINNKKYKNGIGTSISLSIQHLDINILGVMIIPADMPLISAEDLMRLEKEFIAHNCEKVVLPKYKYTIGNPVILPKSYFALLKNLKEDFGARSQIKENDIVKVDCDIGTVFDIDTSKALAKANILVKV